MRRFSQRAVATDRLILMFSTFQKHDILLTCSLTHKDTRLQDYKLSLTARAQTQGVSTSPPSHLIQLSHKSGTVRYELLFAVAVSDCTMALNKDEPVQIILF